MIQHSETQLYAQADGAWTQDMKDAARFEHVHDASAVAIEQRLSQCDIVMSFGDPKYDVRLKIRNGG